MERGGINNEVLINEVCKRRSLWDQKSLEYNNRAVKLKDWEAVAEEVNVSVDEAKNRWKLLKDSFNRELRNITRNSNTPKWIHFEQMSFLLKGSNALLLPTAYLTQSLLETDTQSTTSSCDNEPSSVYNPEDRQSPLPKRKKTKHNFQSLSSGPMIENVYQSTPAGDWNEPGPSSRHDHGNEDYLFLMSLLPTFEKMSPRQKMLLKIKMMQDVYEAMFKVEENRMGDTMDSESGFNSVSSGS